MSLTLLICWHKNRNQIYNNNNNNKAIEATPAVVIQLRLLLLFRLVFNDFQDNSDIEINNKISFTDMTYNFTVPQPSAALVLAFETTS